MRRYPVIILVLFTIKCYGQCGREYPSGFYHNSRFITPQGDTLNKLNSSGLYEGLHLYTFALNNLYNDTISFLLGQFHNGLPVGEWKDHCKDGSYSTGRFDYGSGESTQDGKGEWISKKQGIYVKVGVWKYYDKTEKLLLTERYDRKEFKDGWTDKKYIKDSLGNFVPVKLESKFHYSTLFSNEITKTYSNNGIPISADHENFWKDISLEYDTNGSLKKKTKRKKFFGKELKKTVEKEYNTKGQLKCKTKTKCKHTNSHVTIDYAW